MPDGGRSRRSQTSGRRRSRWTLRCAQKERNNTCTARSSRSMRSIFRRRRIAGSSICSTTNAKACAGSDMAVSNVISLARSQWQAAALKNEKQKIIPNHANMMLALRNDPDLRDAIAYDGMLRAAVMTHEIGQTVTCERRVGEVDIAAVPEWAQKNGLA